MLDIDPKCLTFRDVKLNNAYVSTFSITNPLSVTVSANLKPSSARYTVTPSKITLQPSQSIIVTVRLFIANYANVGKGIRGQEDHISIKSSFFEQKLEVVFFLRENDFRDSPSRSASPSFRRKGSSKDDARDIIEELEAKLKSKNIRIEQLESLVGQLESKYPNLQDIVTSRLNQERAVFDEKSEKVLRILKKKDQTIEQLQTELQEKTERLEDEIRLRHASKNSQGEEESKEKQYLSNKRLSWKENEEQEDFRRKFLDEERAHIQTRKLSDGYQEELLNLRLKIQELESDKKSMQQSSSYPQVRESKYQQELRGLREKNTDQNEQIEVLLAEISRLRDENQSLQRKEKTSEFFQQEMQRLQRELQAQVAANNEQKGTILRMEKQFASERDSYIKMISQKPDLSTTTNHPLPASTTEARSGKISFQAAEYEEQFEGGLGTVTPSRLTLHTSEDIQRGKEQNVLKFELLQDQISHLSQALQECQVEITRRSQKEIALESHIEEMKKSMEAVETDHKSLLEKADRFREERDSLQQKYDQILMDNEKVKESYKVFQIRDSTQDAHVWWSYIWHEMKKLGKAFPMETKSDDADAAAAAVDLTNDDRDSHEVIRLKELLRRQAVDLCSTRQELLSKKLSSKKELDDLRSQLDFSARENLRLHSQIRHQKVEKEIKIGELEMTIRSLSARSEMHQQLSQTRKELEAEKLTVHHLKSEIESYRNMLEHTNDKMSRQQRELSSLQSILDSVDVLKTVTNVPGVDPACLVEIFSGEIIQLKSELSMCKSSLSQSQAQITSLQRNNSKSVGMNDVLVDSARSRSSTPTRNQGQSQTTSSSNSSSTTTTTTPMIASRPPVSSLLLPTMPSYAESHKSAPHDSLKSLGSSLRHDDDGALNPTYPQTFSRDQDRTTAEWDESRSPLSYDRDISMVPSFFSIRVDQDSTPQMILDSLDATLLAQRCHFQDTRIMELSQQCREWEDRVLELEQKRIGEAEEHHDNLEAEYQSCKKRIEILALSKEEIREELERFREKCHSLESQIVDLNAALAEKKLFGRKLKDVSHAETMGILLDLPSLSQNSMIGNEEDALSQEERQDYQKVQNLLRERTAQLRILMETLEALQGSSTMAMNSKTDDFKASTTLIGLASSSWPHEVDNLSIDNSWATRSLVKRVIELSTELASQSASLALEERKCSQLEQESMKKSKELSLLKSSLRSEELTLEKFRLHIESLTIQLRDMEKQKLSDELRLKKDNSKLLSELKEAEGHVSQLQITIEELKNSLKVQEKDDYRVWLNSILFQEHSKLMSDEYCDQSNKEDNNKNNSSKKSNGMELPGANAGSPSDSHDDGSVRSLVQSLLKQWQEHVGPLMQPKTLANVKTTKAEKRFLQRVVDLIMTAHQRCAHVIVANEKLFKEAQQWKSAHELSQRRFTTCLSQLHRYRKRALACESLLKVDSDHQPVQQSRVEIMLRRQLDEQTKICEEYAQELWTERRERRLVNVKLSVESLRLKRLTAKISDLEGRGSSTLRGKEEALNEYEEKIKLVEESMKRWITVELPRIIAGFPIEEDLTSFRQSLRDHNGASSVTSSAFLPISDKTYALTQALCSSKSVQVTQDLKYNNLHEKYAILREKYINMEGVLHRLHEATQKYDDQILTSMSAEDLEIQHSLESQVYHAADVERNLRETNLDSSRKLMEIEEENIELKGRYEFCQRQSIELKKLNEYLLKEEQVLKVKSTQQLIDQKLEMEQENANELQQLRESYEAEKKSLSDELDRVMDALDEHGIILPGSIFSSHRTDESVELDDSMEEAKMSTQSNRKLGGIHRTMSTSSLGRQERGNSSKNTINRRSISSTTSPTPTPTPPLSPTSTVHSMSPALSRTADDLDLISKRRIERVMASSLDLDDLTHKTRKPVEFPSSKSSKDNSQSRAVQKPSQSQSQSQPLHPDDYNEGDLKDSNPTSSTSSNMIPDRNLNSQSSSSSSSPPPPSSPVAQQNMSTNVSHPIFSKSIPVYTKEVIESLELEIESLKRLLGAEREKYESCRAEVTELEHLLEAQRETFSRHLEPASMSSDPGIHCQESISSKVESGSSSKKSGIYDLLDLQQAYQELNQRICEVKLSDVHGQLLAMLLSLDPMNPRLESPSTVTKVSSNNNSLSTMESNVRLPEDDKYRHYSSDHFSEFEKRINQSSSIPALSVYDSFSALANRVKLIENEFADSHQIPERSLFLLRDLRLRVQEIETNIKEEFNRQKTSWLEERARLTRELDEMKMELQNATQSHSSSDTMKARYEEALRAAHDALDVQSKATQEEISRLEAVLSRTQSQLQAMQQERISAMHDHSSHGNGMVGNFQLNEVARLQKMVDDLSDELEHQRYQRRQIEIQSHREKSDLQEQYYRFKISQETLIHELESQLEELKSRESSNMMSENSSYLDAINEATAVVDYSQNHTANYIEQDEKIRSLEARYRMKSAEMEAVMKSMTKSVPSPVSESHSLSLSVSSDHDSSDDRGYLHDIADSIPRDYRPEVVDARIRAAEKEIDLLNNTLSKERKIISTLRNQIASTIQRDATNINGTTTTVRGRNLQVADSFLQASLHEFVLPDDASKEKIRAFVRKVNEFRRQARNEISRLRDCIILNSDGNEVTKQDYEKLRNIVAENQTLIQNLREDNQRKVKILASLKTAKNADSNALEQWRLEAKDSEVSVKRLQRAISSKDALIQDLRNKVQQLEDSIEKMVTTGGYEKHQTVDTVEGNDKNEKSIVNSIQSDINQLPPMELRNRLRVSELERARSRHRLNALKEKIVDLEAELKLFKEDNEKLKKAAEKVEFLKTSLSKKDNLLKTLRGQYDILQENYNKLTVESEKDKNSIDSKLRGYQKEIDHRENIIHDLERENQLMRMRFMKDEETTMGFANSDYVPPLSSHSKPEFSTENRGNKGPSMPSESPSIPRPPTAELPLSLQSSAGDISDIMRSLGVSSRDPNTSVLSDSSSSHSSAPPSSSVEKRFKTLLSSAMKK